MCRLHGVSADVLNAHLSLFQQHLHLKMSARGAPAASPAAPAPPDLSHLTEEERKIILGVMDRQKKEEEKEQTMLK